jgi:hypothetical protein
VSFDGLMADDSIEIAYAKEEELDFIEALEIEEKSYHKNGKRFFL